MKPAEYYQCDRTLHPPAHHPDYKTSVARSPRYSMISPKNSVSEITGTVIGQNDIDPLDSDLIRNDAQTDDPVGERIIVHGRILDENARPGPNALVEIWQANAAGRYAHPEGGGEVEEGFRGCGRIIPDFETSFRHPPSGR